MTFASAPDTRDVNWLLSNFVDGTTGVKQTIAVSSDGLLMAMSSNLDRASADRLAAIVAGLRSLAVRRSLHSIAQPLQFLLQNQSEVGLVFCNQNSCLLLLLAQSVCSSLEFTAERVIVKVVPAPTVDCTSRVPPCSVKIP